MRGTHATAREQFVQLLFRSLPSTSSSRLFSEQPPDHLSSFIHSCKKWWNSRQQGGHSLKNKVRSYNFDLVEERLSTVQIPNVQSTLLLLLSVAKRKGKENIPRSLCRCRQLEAARLGSKVSQRVKRNRGERAERNTLTPELIIRLSLRKLLISNSRLETLHRLQLHYLPNSRSEQPRAACKFVHAPNVCFQTINLRSLN